MSELASEFCFGFSISQAEGLDRGKEVIQRTRAEWLHLWHSEMGLSETHSLEGEGLFRRSFLRKQVVRGSKGLPLGAFSTSLARRAVGSQ